MGWASGLQAGMRLGETLRQGQIQSDLAEESKKYSVTEGAYGQGLQTNIDQLRAMQQQNPEQAQQYEPAIAELTRRVGLTAPDYSVGSRGQNFGSLQEAQQAAAPLRTAGLADVYRRHGEIGEAENLGARAQQQQLAGLQINEATRKDVLAKQTDALNKDYGEWMSKRLVGEDGSYRAPTFDDNIAGAQYRASQFIKAGLPDQAIAQQKDFTQAATAQIQLQDHVRRQAVDATVSRVAAGDLEAAKEFYHKFVPDGANVTNVVKNKDGTISVERETLAGQKLPPTVLPSAKSLMQSIVGMSDGKAVLAYAQQEFDNNVKLQTLEIHKKTANATEAHYNRPQVGALQTFVDSKGEAVVVDVTALPKKEGVIQLPKGLKPRTAKTEPSDAAVTAMTKTIMGDRNQYEMVGGKRVPLTPEQAGEKARRILSGEQVADPADLIIEQMKNWQAQQNPNAD
jgi:hypothetical protein